VKKLDIKILRDCPFTALVLLYKKIFELLLSAAKIYSNQSFFSDFSLYNSCIKSLWCYNPPTPHLMLSCHNLCRTWLKLKYFHRMDMWLHPIFTCNEILAAVLPSPPPLWFDIDLTQYLPFLLKAHIFSVERICDFPIWYLPFNGPAILSLPPY